MTTAPVRVTSTKLHVTGVTVPIELASDAWKRPNKVQPVRITLDYTPLSIPIATETDELDDTLSYSAIYKLLNGFAGRKVDTLRGLSYFIFQGLEPLNAISPCQQLSLTLCAPDGILHSSGGLTYSMQLIHPLDNAQGPILSSTLFAAFYTISSLRIPCIIGVNPHERLSKQDVTLDLSFYLSYGEPHAAVNPTSRNTNSASTSTSGTGTDPAEALFPDLARMVYNSVEKSKYKTVEALGANVGKMVCDGGFFQGAESLTRVVVKVSKGSAYAGVEGVGCEVVVEKEG